MKRTLVLNNAYFPISILPVERAFAIYYKGNAEILVEYDEVFKTVKPPYYPKPSIIRTFSNFFLNYQNVKLTRTNIYKRDNYMCVYCGESGLSNRKKLTLDHVIPRAKGGKDLWNNLVTCCSRCNSEKSDLELHEWGKEYPKPRKPHFLMMLNKSIGAKNMPEEWKPYLFA